MTGDDPLIQALRALRAEYLAEAPQRLAELRAVLAEAISGKTDALEHLARLFHKLAGSGGSYGLPVITEHARAGEQDARNLLSSGTSLSPSDAARLTAHVAGVEQAFAEARTDDSVFH